MTEGEWLQCDDPYRALEWLMGQPASGRERLRTPVRPATERKLRLFACACFRRQLLASASCPTSENAVTVAEGFADQCISSAELRLFHAAFPRRLVAEYLVRPNAAEGARGVVVHWVWERAEHTAILHDLFPNPFRSPRLDPACRTTVVGSLAQAAYDERFLPHGELDTQRLAVLADALEEAGCLEQAVLDHLRQPGPHVRGCWGLDLCLGRE